MWLLAGLSLQVGNSNLSHLPSSSQFPEHSHYFTGIPICPVSFTGHILLVPLLRGENRNSARTSDSWAWLTSHRLGPRLQGSGASMLLPSRPASSKCFPHTVRGMPGPQAARQAGAPWAALVLIKLVCECVPWWFGFLLVCLCSCSVVSNSLQSSRL